MDDVKDPINAGRTATILVWIWLATQLCCALASLFAIYVLGGFGGDLASAMQLERADVLKHWTVIAGLAMLAVAGIAVLRWIAMTNRNAQAWSDQVTITPGWAIGWFFVPVACFFVPFRGVSETWRATVAPADIHSVPVPPLLRWWWGLWLAMSFWSYIPTILMKRATTPARFAAAEWWSIAEIAIDVPLAVVLVRVIARLSAMQREVLIERERTIEHAHEYAS